MNRAFLASFLGASLLAGCASPLAGTLGGGDASLSVLTTIRDGQLRTQAQDFHAYTRADVNHVVLKLYTLTGQNQDVETAVMSGNAQVQADLVGSAIDQPITFRNLHHDTKYRIKAYAYKAVGTASGDLISTEDAASYRDVTVGTSLTPTIASIPIRLIDLLFNSEATGSLSVTNGQIIDATESISVATFYGLTIAGTGVSFTLNGTPAAGLTGYYTPAATQATASVLISNSVNNMSFSLFDMNDGGLSLGSVAANATKSVTVKAQNGAFNLRVDSDT